MERYYFFILFGYLSGSILFARLLPKYLRHIDICELSEDNNPGVFNAFKHAGPVIGSMTLLLELAKGFLPVLCRAPAAGSPEHAVRPGTRRTGLRTCIPAVPAEGRRQVHRSLLWMPPGTFPRPCAGVHPRCLLPALLGGDHHRASSGSEHRDLSLLQPDDLPVFRAPSRHTGSAGHLRDRHLQASGQI